jgi:hypothetical protein
MQCLFLEYQSGEANFDKRPTPILTCLSIDNLKFRFVIKFSDFVSNRHIPLIRKRGEVGCLFANVRLNMVSKRLTSIR